MKRTERERKAEDYAGIIGRPSKVVTSRRWLGFFVDRKRGSKLDAARFIRLEDYVHALVTRRCGEFIACRVKASKTVSVLPRKKRLERVKGD